MQGSHQSASYWRKNLKILILLLSIWFLVSYLLGIVFVEDLNHIKMGGFPLGFWFAQQGSIYVFIVLVLVYAIWMDRLDAQLARDETADSSAGETSGENE